MKSILVPVDLLGGTVKICEAAIGLAQTEGCGLILLHVVPPAPDPERDYYVHDPERIAAVIQSNRKRVADHLERWERWVRGFIPNTKVMIWDGIPAAAIVAAAKTTRADYIVMGSRGHGLAFELLVGGTKRAVIRNSPCPVMEVPIKNEPDVQLAATSGPDCFLLVGIP